MAARPAPAPIASPPARLAGATPAPARIADALAARWSALQRADGTFPDSIRPGTHTWGRYGEAGLGYALILAGVRGKHPGWTEAGARAQAYAGRAARDRLSVFESMLMAAGYNLLRTRAPATPAFASQRAVWEDYLRTIGPVYDAGIDARRLASNKYLVEAVGDLELARSGLRSTVPGAILATPGEARRRALHVLNRLVPRRVRELSGRAAGQRVTALSDRGREPLAYHALATALLARAVTLAGGDASHDARRALRVAARTIWAYQAPDGDLAWSGRSAGQSWALAAAVYGTARAAGRSCGAGARASRAVTERALGRLAALYPIRADGMAIVPSAAGPATVAAIDDYASQVVYNGLTLTALGWAAGERHAPCRRRGRLLADHARAGAVLPFEHGRFATLRRGRVWLAVKQRSQQRDPRSAFGLRALKRRMRGGRWVDLLPAAPAAPIGPLGPALLLRSGARAQARGTSMRVRRGRVVVRGGWVHGGRWVRRGVRFRFVPTGRGARVVVDARRGDRIVYSALTDGRPDLVRRGVVAPRAATLARVPARTTARGPYGSAGSLDVWRSDLTVRATGGRVTFAVRAR